VRCGCGYGDIWRYFIESTYECEFSGFLLRQGTTSRGLAGAFKAVMSNWSNKACTPPDNSFTLDGAMDREMFHMYIWALPSCKKLAPASTHKWNGRELDHEKHIEKQIDTRRTVNLIAIYLREKNSRRPRWRQVIMRMTNDTLQNIAPSHSHNFERYNPKHSGLFRVGATHKGATALHDSCKCMET
jgi:hypothetical protein